MTRTDERGFGLLELLLVIVIIAVLAAIAIPHLQVLRARGVDARVVSAVRQVANGEEAYYASRQRYTASVDDLDGYVANGVTITIASGKSGDLVSSFRVHGSATGAQHAYVWVSDPAPSEPHLTVQ